MSTRIVVTLAKAFCDAEPSIVSRLAERGYDVVAANPGDGPLPTNAVQQLARHCDVLVVGTDPVDAAAIRGASQLKGIVKHGAGVDNIDLAAAAVAGIPVAYAPGINADSVADLAMGFIVALARDIVPAHIDTMAGAWRIRIGHELSGKALGLVGLGEIGRQVTLRALAFGMRVRFFDTADRSTLASPPGVEAADDLDQLLSWADVVSIHVPLLPATRNLIDRQRIARMKPGALLVNTARGGVVDEEAVADAIRDGHLGGAAFDVFATEPPGSPLLGLERVIATPHMGGSTHEAADRLLDLTVRNVVAILKGERPAALAGPSAGARPSADPA